MHGKRGQDNGNTVIRTVEYGNGRVRDRRDSTVENGSRMVASKWWHQDGGHIGQINGGVALAVEVVV